MKHTGFEKTRLATFHLQKFAYSWQLFYLKTAAAAKGQTETQHVRHEEISQDCCMYKGLPEGDPTSGVQQTKGRLVHS